MTLLVHAPARLARGVAATTGLVGVRVPAHAVSRALAKASAHLLTATSANISDQPDTLGADEVLIAFATDQDGLPAVLDGGQVPGGVASTVVDLTVTPARVLREGPISAGQVAKVVELG